MTLALKSYQNPVLKWTKYQHCKKVIIQFKRCKGVHMHKTFFLYFLVKIVNFKRLHFLQFTADLYETISTFLLNLVWLIYSRNQFSDTSIRNVRFLALSSYWSNAQYFLLQARSSRFKIFFNPDFLSISVLYI